MNNDLNYTVSEKDNNYIVSVCNVNPDKAHELTLTLLAKQLATSPTRSA